jgi:hypothetical protein
MFWVEMFWVEMRQRSRGVLLEKFDGQTNNPRTLGFS